MARIAAVHVVNGEFLGESPSDTLNNRLMTYETLPLAKKDFADQTAINTYVTARGGNTALWTALTLPDTYKGR